MTRRLHEAQRHRCPSNGRLTVTIESVRKLALTAGFPDIIFPDGYGQTKRRTMPLVGYARISTSEQDMALQLDALATAGCAQMFQDTASGAKADRPGLTAALSYMRKGDVLVVWKLDRLGRSLPHLIETVTNLEKRGIGFRSLTEAIDTTTSGGRLIFHIFGALGQFERDLIRERTRAGLDAAISRGRRGGRRPVITAEKLRRARTLIEQGFTVREAAARIKVGKTALYVALGAKADAAVAAK
jgi:DNA invertase Pin-like site-specific DNA recombinase